MSNIKYELCNMKKELDFWVEVKCTDEEIKEYSQMRKDKISLPADIYLKFKGAEDYFYKYQPIGTLTEKDLNEYIMLKQAKDIQDTKEYIQDTKKDIHTIKNCVIFFTVTAVVGIVIAIFSFMAASGIVK